MAGFGLLVCLAVSGCGGTGGLRLATQDGGDTWQWQESGTDRDLSAVVAFDAVTAWVAGVQGTALTTFKRAVDRCVQLHEPLTVVAAQEVCFASVPFRLRTT